MNRFRIAIMMTLGCALSIALSAQAPEPAPGDTIGWHEVRAGETLSGITERYLGDSELWPENHRLNPDIKDPNRLTPGQRIRIILSRELPARRAEVERVARRVEKKPKTADWTSAAVGDELREREGIRTYPSSSAELTFDDGSNLLLTENSMVFLREYKSSIRRVDRSLIEVVDGGVDVAVAPTGVRRRGNDVEIVVGGATARPRSSDSTARARARKDTTSDSAKFMVYAGVSEVVSAGTTVQVAKGMGTSVKQGEAPKPPERLLAAPRLELPGVDETVSNTMDLTWKSVQNAGSYTVEVCRDQRCAQLVERQVDLLTTSTKTKTLPSGDLYWRVTARSRSGLDGFSSESRRVIAKRLVAGRVLIDRTATLDPSKWQAGSGARVRLFEDDGDGAPGEGDKLLVEKTTDGSGFFVFEKLANGVYWTAVDSRSVSPEGTWFEQVGGPAGSLCSDGNGGSRFIEKQGACYGGRRGNEVDSFASLGSSEHVVRLRVDDAAEPRRSRRCGSPQPG